MMTRLPWLSAWWLWCHPAQFNGGYCPKQTWMFGSFCQQMNWTDSFINPFNQPASLKIMRQPACGGFELSSLFPDRCFKCCRALCDRVTPWIRGVYLFFSLGYSGTLQFLPVFKMLTVYNMDVNSWFEKVKPMWTCFKPKFFLMASSGQLHWFQKNVKFYVIFWENDPTFSLDLLPQ